MIWQDGEKIVAFQTATAILLIPLKMVDKRQQNMMLTDVQALFRNLRCLHITLYSKMCIKWEIQCKMDLGYVLIDNELECSLGGKKACIDAFLNWLFLADSTTPSCF